MAAIQGQNYQRYLYNIVALYKQRQDLKAYLEILLSIAAVGVFVIFAIKPTFITIADLIVKIDNQQKTSDALDLKIKNLGIAQTTLNQQQNNIKLLDDAIPSGPSYPAYIRQVEGAIQKEGVTEDNLTSKNIDLLGTSASGSASFTLTTNVSGNYQNILSFIKDIENLRRPSILDKITFTANSLNVINETPYY